MKQKLRSMAERLGGGGADLESGHTRWEIYARAIEIPGEWPALLELVRSEPDISIASSVVLKVMEVVPASQRLDYVAALPAGKSREYAATRARELSIWETITKTSVASGEEEFDTRSWSTWLQLRAADSARDEAILEALSATGATKRIRAVAERRLLSIRASGD
jgi:hypothetical protein